MYDFESNGTQKHIMQLKPTKQLTIFNDVNHNLVMTMCGGHNFHVNSSNP